MGIFSFFKRKDDFDNILKDPLSDPLGKMPQMPGQTPFPSEQGDLPNFDSGLPKDDLAMGGFSQNAMSSDNYSTSAATPQNIQGSYGPSAPPLPRRREPEVYEEVMAKELPKNEIPIDKRDVEMLNLKLDAIKSQLETLNQRLATLDTKSRDDEVPRPRRYAW